MVLIVLALERTTASMGIWSLDPIHSPECEMDLTGIGIPLTMNRSTTLSPDVASHGR